MTNILTDESRQYFEKYLQMETDNDFNSIIQAVTEYSKSCYETALQFFSNGKQYVGCYYCLKMSSILIL